MTDIIRTGGKRAYILDLFFPNRCPFCGGFIPYDVLCCEECFNKVLWADDNICLDCGKSRIKGCLCGEKKLHYDMCIPAAYYIKEAKNAVLSMKYKHHTDAAELYGRILRDRMKVLGILDKIDAAVPVPMTSAQKRRRGYNQAELIAAAAVKGTDIPLMNDALLRKNVHTEQHLLNADERSASVSKQYFASEGTDLSGKTVLLADDVLTTGATLDYCAYLLKEKLGAEKVICIVCTTV